MLVLVLGCLLLRGYLTCDYDFRVAVQHPAAAPLPASPNLDARAGLARAALTAAVSGAHADPAISAGRPTTGRFLVDVLPTQGFAAYVQLLAQDVSAAALSGRAAVVHDQAVAYGCPARAAAPGLTALGCHVRALAPGHGLPSDTPLATLEAAFASVVAGGATAPLLPLLTTPVEFTSGAPWHPGPVLLDGTHHERQAGWKNPSSGVLACGRVGEAVRRCTTAVCTPRDLAALAGSVSPWVQVVGSAAGWPLRVPPWSTPRQWWAAVHDFLLEPTPETAAWLARVQSESMGWHPRAAGEPAASTDGGITVGLHIRARSDRADHDAVLVGLAPYADHLLQLARSGRRIERLVFASDDALLGPALLVAAAALKAATAATGSSAGAAAPTWLPLPFDAAGVWAPLSDFNSSSSNNSGTSSHGVWLDPTVPFPGSVHSCDLPAAPAWCGRLLDAASLVLAAAGTQATPEAIVHGVVPVSSAPWALPAVSVVPAWAPNPPSSPSSSPRDAAMDYHLLSQSLEVQQAAARDVLAVLHSLARTDVILGLCRSQVARVAALLQYAAGRQTHPPVAVDFDACHGGGWYLTPILDPWTPRVAPEALPAGAPPRPWWWARRV